MSHLGEPTSPLRLMPARVPSFRGTLDTTMGDDDPLPQPAPTYEFDQSNAG